MGSIDPANLGKWFDAYGAGLVLYARQWLEAAQAEEVVQDVFVQMMSLRSAPQSGKAWLFTAVRNAAISRLRSQQRYRKHTQRLAGERREWFAARPDDAIDAATAQAALAGLPREQREVIVLRIWAGMTLQEVADVTGQSISTLFSRYQAGLAELRKRMGSPCEKKKD